MYSYDYHSIGSGKVQLHFGLLGCDGVFSLHQLKISRMDTAYQQHEAGIFHISSATQKRPTFFSWKTNGRAPEGFLCVKPSRFVGFPGLVARSQFRATLWTARCGPRLPRGGITWETLSSTTERGRPFFFLCGEIPTKVIRKYHLKNTLFESWTKLKVTQKWLEYHFSNSCSNWWCASFSSVQNFRICH